MSDIKLEGLDNVLGKLNSIANPATVEKAIGKACALVERAAKEKAPKGTGELRRSITSRIEDDGGDIVGIVYTSLEYAPYVEFGTGSHSSTGGGTPKDHWAYMGDDGKMHIGKPMKARPYLKPAVANHVGTYRNIFKDELSSK